uniref:tetratricopeptide repeat protein n=1 Tax=Flavobacterium sp. TaxID=239 RepID=UPI00404B21C0
MKKILFLLVISTSFGWSQAIFDQANDAYKKGNYEQATDLYRQIIADGKQSCDLYYNLGNAYFKQDSLAQAIYFYEKALLISPNDKDMQNNLAFAKTKTIDAIEELPKVGFNKLMHNFTGSFHFNTWGKFAIVWGFVFVLFFIGYYFSDKTFNKRLFFVGMFVIPFFLISSLFAGWFEKYLHELENPAIIFEPVLSVKNEPRNKSTEAFQLHEGTKVYVLEELDGWYRIKLSDDNEGWIPIESVKEIK